MKEDQSLPPHPGAEAGFAANAMTHLSFRRIVIHDFSDGGEPEPVRFHYREHSKHIPPRRAA